MKHIYTWQHKNAVGKIIGEIKRFIDDDGNKQDIPYYNLNQDSSFDSGTTEAMKTKGNMLFGLDRTCHQLSQTTLAAK
jgi:hypothetical protein